MNLHRNTIVILVATPSISGVIVLATYLYNQAKSFEGIFILVTLILVIGSLYAARYEMKHGKDTRK
jgi:uncharacterized membrane protein